MKTNKVLLKLMGIILLGTVLLSSCEKYLDKAPEAAISEEDIFTKFTTFQGFMEDVYQNVLDETMGKAYREYNFNWGDEVIHDWRNTMVEERKARAVGTHHESCPENASRRHCRSWGTEPLGTRRVGGGHPFFRSRSGQ